jgi:hypothetical protein
MGMNPEQPLTRDAVVEGAIRKNQNDFENRQTAILGGQLKKV